MAEGSASRGQARSEARWRPYLALPPPESTRASLRFDSGATGAYAFSICSPLDTPRGLGRGYFVPGCSVPGEAPVKRATAFIDAQNPLTPRKKRAAPRCAERPEGEVGRPGVGARWARRVTNNAPKKG